MGKEEGFNNCRPRKNWDKGCEGRGRAKISTRLQIVFATVEAVRLLVALFYPPLMVARGQLSGGGFLVAAKVIALLLGLETGKMRKGACLKKGPKAGRGFIVRDEGVAHAGAPAHQQARAAAALLLLRPLLVLLWCGEGHARIN